MRLAHLFTDHAVFQRLRPIPVWGWTAPRRVVSIKLLGAGEVRAVTRANDDGKFIAWLPAQNAGGPFTLEAADLTDLNDGGAQSHITVRDIYIGEVWLASGQSNMEMAISGSGRTPYIDGAWSDGVRMITVPHVAVFGAAEDFNAEWQTATDDTAPAFSAAAYHFAARLANELGVRVGIIHSSWGGTIAEAWLSREALAQNPAMQAMLERYTADTNASAYWEKILRDGTLDAAPLAPSDLHFDELCPPIPENLGVGAGWASPDFSVAEWDTMNLPGAWSRDGFNTNGVFWFRREIAIAPEDAGKDWRLELGAVDKQDITYWNGEEIGRTGAGYEEKYWNFARVYQVPGRLVRAGANVIAVRAYSFAFDGGLIGPAIRAMPASGAAVNLAGAWRFKIEHDLGKTELPAASASAPGQNNPNSPHILFDRMIRPLIPYALRGVIWYQGESNDHAPENYRQLIIDLVRDWRRRWMQGDFPFIQTQLANFLEARDFDPQAKWSLIREAQLQATAEPHLGMITAIDLGEADCIHPHDKKSVGERLANWALAKTYHRADLAAHGPHFSRYQIEGDKIRVFFTGVDRGLKTRDGAAPQTCVIAGIKRQFAPAQAKIDGETLLIWNPEIAEPMAARYAWSNNPAAANLVNGAGQPASSFRTDQEFAQN